LMWRVEGLLQRYPMGAINITGHTAGHESMLATLISHPQN